MSSLPLSPLISLSVTDPAAAARAVIGLGLSRNTLWMGLLLISVLQALLFSLVPGAMVFPDALQPIANNPLLLAMVVAGGVVLVAFVLTWSGTLIGGAGDLTAVLAVLTWFQVLRAIAVLITFLLAAISKELAAALSLGLMVLGVFIFVAMIDVAQGFGSRLKALFLIIFSFLAVTFGTSLVLTMLAVLVIGMG